MKTIDELRRLLREADYLGVYEKGEDGQYQVQVYCHGKFVLGVKPDGAWYEGDGVHAAMLGVAWWQALNCKFDDKSRQQWLLMLHALRADGAAPSREVLGLCAEYEFRGVIKGGLDPDYASPEPEGKGVWLHESGYLKAVWEDGWLVEGVQNPMTDEWDDLWVTQVGVASQQIRREGEFLPAAWELTCKLSRTMCFEHFGVVV